MQNSFRSLLVAFSVLLSFPASAEPKMDLKLPNEMSVFTRQTGVGTNNQRVLVTRHPLAEGRMATIVEGAVREATAGCALEGMTIVVEEGTSRDYIGSTNSRITGTGLYISLPDTGVASSGNWYVAPVVMVNLSLRDSSGTPLEKQSVSDFERVPVSDSTYGDFFKMQGSELDRAVSDYAMKRIAIGIRTLVAKRCRGGG